MNGLLGRVALRHLSHVGSTEVRRRKHGKTKPGFSHCCVVREGIKPTQGVKSALALLQLQGQARKQGEVAFGKGLCVSHQT